GVDGGLVCTAVVRHDAAREGLLRAPQSAWRERGRQPRDTAGCRALRPQGTQGWFAPVRGQLLPPLPAGRAAGADRGKQHLACRVSLCARYLRRGSGRMRVRRVPEFSEGRQSMRRMLMLLTASAIAACTGEAPPAATPQSMDTDAATAT